MGFDPLLPLQRSDEPLEVSRYFQDLQDRVREGFESLSDRTGFRGWDADTNSPPLVAGVAPPDPAIIYVVEVAGTTNLGANAPGPHALRDWIWWDAGDSTWHATLFGSDAVTSFNTRQGAVVAIDADYAAGQVVNDSNVSGARVDDALNTNKGLIDGLELNKQRKLRSTDTKTASYTAVVGEMVHVDATFSGITITTPLTRADGQTFGIRITKGFEHIGLDGNGTDLAEMSFLAGPSVVLVMTFDARDATWKPLFDADSLQREYSHEYTFAGLPLGSDGDAGPLTPVFVPGTGQTETIFSLSGDLLTAQFEFFADIEIYAYATMDIASNNSGASAAIIPNETLADSTTGYIVAPAVGVPISSRAASFPLTMIGGGSRKFQPGDTYGFDFVETDSTGIAEVILTEAIARFSNVVVL